MATTTTKETETLKLLSIDVGIKNLAFCLFIKPAGSDQFQIEKWDTVNLSQPTEESTCMIMDKTKICGKLAKFEKNNKCFCLKHAKKQPFLIPSAELKPPFINKQKIKTLYEIAAKYKIVYESNIKKVDLVLLINNYVLEKCLEPINKTNASKVDLVTIGRNIQHKFDDILKDNITTIHNVIIENQISPIANRMKTIQGMISQYFIMRNDNIQIDFISSANKLKDCATELKSKYSDRKKLSIQVCLANMNTYKYNDWLPFFNTHSKKDDLADSFLQGLWFINNRI